MGNIQSGFKHPVTLIQPTMQPQRADSPPVNEKQLLLLVTAHSEQQGVERSKINPSQSQSRVILSLFRSSLLFLLPSSCPLVFAVMFILSWDNSVNACLCIFYVPRILGMLRCQTFFVVVLVCRLLLFTPGLHINSHHDQHAWPAR